MQFIKKKVTGLSFLKLWQNRINQQGLDDFLTLSLQFLQHLDFYRVFALKLTCQYEKINCSVDFSLLYS